MDEIQRKSNENYAKLATGQRDMLTTAGRYARDQELLPNIWSDIVRKCLFTPKLSVLDIGCGYGYVTKQLITQSRELKLDLTLVDIPEVLDAVRSDLLESDSQNDSGKINLVSGTFPDQISDKSLISRRFDRIILYSVIHCTAHPLPLIDAAIQQLKTDGLLFIGDIPNMNKKGRFLASVNGRQFEASYQNMPIDKVTLYRDHHDFLERNRANPLSTINDEMVAGIIRKYRDTGYDVYVMPQPEGLPFCFTREDLLIRKYD